MKKELVVPKVLRDWFEKGEDTTFWGQKCHAESVMADTVLGNGGKLALITPLATRPNYYGILVDSSWTEDELSAQSERIIQAIEESFGNSDDETDDDGEPIEADWPAWHDGGHSWCFIREGAMPASVLDASRADIARQIKEQDALFVGGERIQPGHLLDHPEFGKVQARYNEGLGWHYCRRAVFHDFQVDSLGYGTDFSAVTLTVSEEGAMDFDNSGIHVTFSTPLDARTEKHQSDKSALAAFEQILAGDERSLAHVKLCKLIADGDDAAALAIVKTDPSLFLEPIPTGPQFTPEWNDRARWHGNWLSKAADIGFPKTIEAMLALGVHPDDPNAFMLRPLIQCVEWYSRPERLALALDKCAAPDSPAEYERPGGYRADPSASLLRKCLCHVQFSKKHNQGVTYVKSAELLLAAGARAIDPVTYDVLYDDGRVARSAKDAVTGVGILMSNMQKLDVDTCSHQIEHDLIRKLHAAGADISRPSNGTPPVISAIRVKDLPTFELLLQLGVKTGDADVVRKNEQTWRWRDTGSLLDEAESAGGASFKSDVTEMLMLHVLSQNRPAAAPTVTRRARRLA